MSNKNIDVTVIDFMGLEVKGLNVAMGHDGEGILQGNIYCDNKKKGRYSQDSWGGEDYLDVDNETSLKLVALAKQLNVGNAMFHQPTLAAYDLCVLKDFETRVKRKYKASKKYEVEFKIYGVTKATPQVPRSKTYTISFSGFPPVSNIIHALTSDKETMAELESFDKGAIEVRYINSKMKVRMLRIKTK